MQLFGAFAPVLDRDILAFDINADVYLFGSNF